MYIITENVLRIFKENYRGNVGFSPYLIRTGNAGSPKLEVCKGQLNHFIENGFSIRQMASMLNVSKSTIKRRLFEFGLKIKQTYTLISNEELDLLIETILN